MRAVTDEFPERFLTGEVDAASERAAHFYGDPSRPAVHAPINFALHGVPWDGRSVTAEIDEYLHTVPRHGWPNWALGAHDKPRTVSRVGQAQARVAAMLYLTLPGTTFFFAGDELGVPNVDIPPDRIRDPFEKLVPGYGLCRDPERTPMRWTPEAKAGFTTGEPWLPFGPDIAALNVQAQMADKRSMAALYRELIALRHTHPALRSDALEPVRAPADVVAFRRTSLDGETMLVALNLGASPQRLDDCGSGSVLLSTHLDREGVAFQETLELRADEGLVVAT
jgi:alpha-glucosidase